MRALRTYDIVRFSFCVWRHIQHSFIHTYNRRVASSNKAICWRLNTRYYSSFSSVCWQFMCDFVIGRTQTQTHAHKVGAQNILFFFSFRFHFGYCTLKPRKKMNCGDHYHYNHNSIRIARTRCAQNPILPVSLSLHRRTMHTHIHAPTVVSMASGVSTYRVHLNNNT